MSPLLNQVNDKGGIYMVERNPVKSKESPKNMPTDDFMKDVANAVNKKFGEGTAMIAGEDSEMLDIPFWVRTDIPSLDYAVGGHSHPGVPGGRIIEVYGAESHGKTTVAMWILKKLIDGNNGIGIFQDTEHALSMERAEQMGLDMNKVIYTQPEIMEDVFESQEIIIETLREKNTDRPIGIVWDSVAATSTKSEIEGEYGDAVMGIHARIMSQALRKIKGQIKKQNVMAIYINQIRDKMGVMFGEKTSTFGGRALKFYSTVRLEVTRIQTLKDKNNKPSGITVRVSVRKNKVAPPFRESEFDILFDENSGVIDYMGATLDWLKEHELIGGSQGWYEIEGKNYRKEDAKRMLLDDEKLYKKYYDLAYSVSE